MPTFICYFVGALLTYLAALFVIRKKWWTRSGAADSDGRITEWKVGSFDAYFIAVSWPVIIPMLLVIGMFLGVDSLGKYFIQRLTQGS